MRTVQTVLCLFHQINRTTFKRYQNNSIFFYCSGMPAVFARMFLEARTRSESMSPTGILVLRVRVSPNLSVNDREHHPLHRSSFNASSNNSSHHKDMEHQASSSTYHLYLPCPPLRISLSKMKSPTICRWVRHLHRTCRCPHSYQHIYKVNCMDFLQRHVVLTWNLLPVPAHWNKNLLKWIQIHLLTIPLQFCNPSAMIRNVLKTFKLERQHSSIYLRSNI